MNQTHSQTKSTDDDQLQVEDGEIIGDENDDKNFDDIFDIDEGEHERRAAEERKKRREALLAQFEEQKLSNKNINDSNSNNINDSVNDKRDNTQQNDGDFVVDLSKSDLQANNRDRSVNNEGISAADYDDTLDRREDQQKIVNNSNYNKSEEDNGDSKDDGDDDDDDMFAIADEPKPKKQKVDHKTAKAALPVDGSTNAEGYYIHTLGETLDNGRYTIFSSLGSGMFSNVVRVKDNQDNQKEFAVKIIRSQESMYKAAQREIALLQRLADLDPNDKKHVVRVDRTFEHRGHLCIVFENLNMNLREILKRFGANVGINIRAVRAYAYQILLALSLFKKANIMHADLKPDNILVSENKAHLKVCDLGSASDVNENDITPYLVSRFYRAPEIILGLNYDTGIDIWSIGCTLYEMYTGQILFPGKTNNEMLRKMMELKGKFNHRMIKKGKFGINDDQFVGHFTDTCDFIAYEWDKLNNQNIAKVTPISKPTKDLKSRLLPSINEQRSMKDDEIKSIYNFVDLLDKMLMLDPQKRISAKDALSHPFFIA